MNSDGSEERQVTRTEAEAYAPSWSPDSTKLAFQSNRSGGTKIFVINLDGTGLVRVAGGSGYGDYVPDWQRDPEVTRAVLSTTTTTTAPPPTTRPPVRRRR